MTETHNYSAFQGISGLIITSPSREGPFFFIKCIKMKQNNMWERPSLKEGITVKIGLEELGNMVAVVKHKCQTWSNVHEYQNKKTSISLSLHESNKIKLMVDNFSIILNIGQTNVLTELLSHLFKEKVKYATGTKKKKVPTPYKKSDTPIKNSKITSIDASIRGESDKALLLLFISSEKTVWIPKSVIHNTYDLETKNIQQFLMDTWIIDKNNLLEKEIYRQGDVMLKEIETLPSNLIQIKNCLVAEGEQTGHAHIIDNGAVFEVLNEFNLPSKLYVVANDNTKIVHDEHHALSLKEGLYEVIIQKEFLGWGKQNPQDAIEEEVSD